MDTQADVNICLSFYYPKDHMLILLTFEVSDGKSHGPLLRPDKCEEELVGVKNKKKEKILNNIVIACTFAPPVSLRLFYPALLFSNPSFHFFSDAAHVPTSDSDLHDGISPCLPAALLEVCACACVRLSAFECVRKC